jgi:membrane-associated HD superfamily phosphohydrolase
MASFPKNSIALLIVVFLCLPLVSAFPQNTSNPADQESVLTESVSSDTITKAVEKAINETETAKEKKNAELSAQIRLKLDQAVNAWISQAKQDKASDLNKLLHENWKNIVTVTLPIPNDYYLRDFEYLIAKQDCVKSDSIITPYEAEVIITEKLYVEGYHAPGISDVSPYLYTISRPITINLKYSQDDFVISNTEFGPLDISR